ncbi:MAG TPA: EF-hand domain-containing protein [Luteolibacter sp.]
MKSSRLQWLLALAASVTATAQPPQPHGGERRPPPVPPLFAILDTDQDKVISADEIQAAADALGKLDKNNDGKITLEELRMPPPDGKKGPKHPPSGKPPIPPVIAALDADGDGTISAAELENAPDSLKALDKDGDGALSPEEIRPGPPPRAGDQDGNDRPQGPPPGYGGAE